MNKLGTKAERKKIITNWGKKNRENKSNKKD